MGEQSADGDSNTQIGGDGNVAGGDITIIQGVPPSEHAKALAQIEILKEKLAIAQAADKEDPTEEEVLAAEEAMEVAEDLEEMGAELNPWNYLKLGDAAELRGRTITAAGYNREALRLFLRSGNREGEARALLNLGNIAHHRFSFDGRDLNEAERLYNEALAIYLKIGSRSGEAYSLHNLGNIALKRKDLDEAERLYNESLAIKREIGDLSNRGEASTVYQLGQLANNRGDWDEAERLFIEALAIELKIGDRQGEAKTLFSLGNIALDRKDMDEAERLHKESLAIKREIGNRKGEAYSLNNLGLIAKNRGDYDEAERLFRESIRIKNEISIPLDDWFVENGYTDPDAPWDYPPSDRPPVPPAASKSVKQTAHGDGNIQIGGDANIQIDSKTPPAGFDYTIRIGHDVKGTPTLNLKEVSDCIMKELKKNGIDAATVKEAGGFWEDRWELSTEISIVWPSSEDKGDGIKEACRAVCKQLDQDAVLYTKIELSDIEFVERGEG